MKTASIILSLILFFVTYLAVKDANYGWAILFSTAGVMCFIIGMVLFIVKRIDDRNK